MKTIKRISVLVYLFMLVACGSSTQAPLPTQISSAIPTKDSAQLALPTPTTTLENTPQVLPLYQRVNLRTSASEETGTAPDYTIKTKIPVLQGSSDPRIDRFNTDVNSIIQVVLNQFRSDLANQPAAPLMGGSFLDISYALISPQGDILSIQLQIEGMSDGAAHPYHTTISYTYNLETGQQVNLNQLFLHGVNALQTIADYCKAELGTRDIGFESFASGAEPLDENYSVWNISAAGLLIVFNEYQVAPYAAGTQTIIVPWADLKKLINPAGPLSNFPLEP